MINMNCLVCNKEFSISKYRLKSAKYCSVNCMAEGYKGKHLSPKTEFKKGQKINFKGGHIDKRGYKIIYANERRIFEHRYIWKKYNGELPKGVNYQIHHKNGIKDDNRIENLQLLTNSEHQKLHQREKEMIQNSDIH